MHTKFKIDFLINSRNKTLLGLAFGFIFFNLSAQQQIIYVDSAATGKNDGTSWENAFTDLQSALKPNTLYAEIHVAKGTYYPSKDNQATSFFLLDYPLIGGFGKVGNIYIRDPKQFPTILSGNIGDKSTDADNSYHIIKGLNRHWGSSKIDGFIIEDGNADSPNLPITERVGGGIIIANSTSDGSSSVAISNCTFNNNKADAGGAIYTMYYEDQPTMLIFIDSCSFIGNKSGYNSGGAIYSNAPPTSISGPSLLWITSCLFENNSSLNSGGGIYLNNIFGIYSISKCRFNNNSVQSDGSAIACYQTQSGNVKLNLYDNVFEANEAVGDGTVWILQEQKLSDSLKVLFQKCQFKNNLSYSNNGGAIFATNYANFNLNIDSCLFYKNKSRNEGGAIYLENDFLLNLKISKSQFIKNTTLVNATGGIFVAGFTTSKWKIKNNILIENTLFQNNKDATAFAMGTNGQMKTIFNHCTFYNNGEYVIGKTTDTAYNNIDRYNICEVYNSIFYEKYAPINTLFYNGNYKNYTIHDYRIKNCMVSLPNLKYGTTDIDFGGNIFNQYPIFKDTLNGDFRLDSCSLAVNVGYNFITDSLMITKDLAGNNRKFENVVDMGAYVVQSKCTTATNELETENTLIRISPNPAYDLLTVQISLTNEDTEIVICDLTGKELLKTTLTDFADSTYMDVSVLAAGMYIVQLKQVGRLMKTGKVVIQRR